jgi:acyl-coenzyme A thioesterase PaaI-like protein
MAFSGLDLANAIKAGKSPFAPAPWIEHMRVIEENPIQIVEPGRIVTHWTPGQQFTVADGYVQGGLLSAMADGGQFMTIVTTLETVEAWVTTDLHTRFVRPIKAGERVEIESRLLSKTKTAAIVETTFTLLDGKLAAKITGGWRRSETRTPA